VDTKRSKRVDYLVNQAQEKAMTGDHFSAVKYLKKQSISIQECQSTPLLGNCQDCMDKIEDAIASYDKALEMDPKRRGMVQQGNDSEEKGQIEESTQCIEKCINLFCGT